MSELTDSQGISLNPTRNVKRKYEKYCICVECEKFSVQSNLVVRYLCTRCGRGNNAEEAVSRFAEWDKGELELTDKSQAPALVRVDGGKLAYTKFRDEMQIRSDMFVGGKTRDSMGSHNFRKQLKRELMHEKAYRGEKSDVD